MSRPDGGGPLSPVRPSRDLASDLVLMIVTDPIPASGRTLPDVVRSCLGAGATAVQLRDKTATPARLLATAREIRVLARAHDALFIVNDHLDVALAADADGVHLGPHDLPVAAARRLVAPEFVIGASCDQPHAARALVDAGADYLGVGAVFGTRTKPELHDEHLGLDGLRAVASAVSVPCVGIGSITPSNARCVFGTGSGVAVISAVMGALDPAEAVRRILATHPNTSSSSP